MNPIIKDNSLINVKISYGKLENKKYQYSISFKDSFLLLPSSLAKLAKNFNVENKGIFPYSFVNNNNVILDYIGSVPSTQYPVYSPPPPLLRRSPAVFPF